jgi:hypothetical protein
MLGLEPHKTKNHIFLFHNSGTPTDCVSRVDVCVYICFGPGPGLILGSARVLSSPQSPDRLWGPPTQPPVVEALSLGVQGQGPEDDSSPPSSTKVEKGGAISSLPHMSRQCLMN